MEEGQILRAIREAIDRAAVNAGGKGLLATKLDCHANQISRWQQGTRPELETLIKIFDFAGLSLDELAGKSAAPPVAASPYDPDVLTEVLENTREILQTLGAGQMIVTGSFRTTPAAERGTSEGVSEGLEESLRTKVRAQSKKERGTKHG